MATEQEKADLAKKRGAAAATITDPEKRKAFIAAQGNDEAKSKGNVSDESMTHMNREADDTLATGGENKNVMGSYKKGTSYVPKTGNYKLHEGEAVIPANENKDGKMDSNHSPSEKAHFSRAMHHLHKGALHKHLGIPEDQPIPMEKKQEAANSDNPHVAAMGRMAVAMHGWKHGK